MKKDIPVPKEVVEAVWRKEEELTGLKTELNNLERQIKLSLKPIEQTEGKSSEAVADNQLRQEAPKLTQSTLNGELTGVLLPHNLRQLEEVLGERLIIVSIDREDKQEKNGMPSRVCCKNERLFVFTQPLYFKYLTSQINHHHIYFEDNKKGLFQKLNYSRKRLMLLTLTRDIVKHKNDIFRMVFMLNPDDRYSLIEKLKYDLQLFVDTVKNDLPHPEIFNINGFGRQNMQSIFDRFILIFNLNA